MPNSFSASILKFFLVQETKDPSIVTAIGLFTYYYVYFTFRLQKWVGIFSFHQ